MKAALFIVIAVIGIGYYVLNYHSPFQTQVTDPYYVEFFLGCLILAAVGFNRWRAIQADKKAATAFVGREAP